MLPIHAPSLGTPLAFAEPLDLLARLRARYDEPHRRYHDWSHVLACFAARDQLTVERHPALDLALLFHDAIYEPLAHDNEERSARLLVAEGARATFDPGLLERAAALVLATKDHVADSDEACLVLDADLAILGAASGSYAAYQRDVRAEFECVPDEAYQPARAAVLRRFLDRPMIYRTARGQALWEERARTNLAAELADLARIGSGPSVP